MADKRFIGKTFEHTFSNGDIVLKLTLTEAELETLLKEAQKNKTGVTVETKKSKSGKWYSEISSYAPKAQQHPEPSTGDDNAPRNAVTSYHQRKKEAPAVDASDDLPF
jgi:hypothetical protein